MRVGQAFLVHPSSGLAPMAIFQLLVRAAATLLSSSTALADASFASDEIQQIDFATMAFAKALVQLFSCVLCWSRNCLGTSRMALFAERKCDSTALR